MIYIYIYTSIKKNYYHEYLIKKKNYYIFEITEIYFAFCVDYIKKNQQYYKCDPWSLFDI